MASPPSLRRGCLWLVLALSAALLVIGLVLALIVNRQLPLSSLPLTVLLLGLLGAALSMVFTLHLTAPAIGRRRDRALIQVLADVTAGKYPAAPDEVWLFKRRGWWTPGRELTPLGQGVLAQNGGAPRG